MKLKNKPAKGQKLHTFIALGGKPQNYNKVNKVEGKPKPKKAK